MANLKPGLIDGYLSFLGGVDSGRRPFLVAENQVGWATNCQFRGGVVSKRPNFVKRGLISETAATLEALEEGKFQGVTVHRHDDGHADLVMVADGRVFRVNVPEFCVLEVTPGGFDPFSRGDLAYFSQAERFTVIQNGVDAPVYYVDGAGRVGTGLYGDEVPTARVMAYGNGRLWIADGSSYAAGDLVGSSSGSQTAFYRDSVIKFVENTFIAEGGSFTTPLTSGDIRAMSFLGTLDTVFGEGELIIFTEKAVFATQVPFDRTVWKDLNYPVQRVVAYGGAVSHRAVVNVDNDVYFRGWKTVRSLMTARRDSSQPGNVPISSEVRRVLDLDTPHLMKYGSMVWWNGWLIATAAATRRWAGGVEKGVVHEALVVLDFDQEGSLRGKAPAAWSGVWTGLDVLQVVSGDFGGRERCFLVADVDGVTELWEIEEDGEEDGVAWSFETRSFVFQAPLDQKLLDRVEVALSGIRGEVTVRVRYRTDEAASWITWKEWTENARVGVCAGDVVDGCLAVQNRNAGHRPRRVVAEAPIATVVSDPCYQSRLGYRFQVRVEMEGEAAVDAIRLFADRWTDGVYPVCPSGNETEETVCEPDPYPKVSDG